MCQENCTCRRHNRQKKSQICAIYAILNTETGEMYIGSSRNALVRMNWHYAFLRRGVHPIRKLRNALQEYGIEAFTPVLLEECSLEEQFNRETFWIQEQNPEYNSARNASKENLGVILSEEFRQFLSSIRKGKPSSKRGSTLSQETKDKISASLTGKPPTSGFTGYQHSEETKAKMRETWRLKKIVHGGELI